MISSTAFVLAAGFGRRLRPYTDHCPKPMVRIAGRSLLDRTLDHVAREGITEAVVNTHYKADLLHEALKDRAAPAVHISHEPVLMDTGGGIKTALPYFKNRPFFVLSGDGLWDNGPGGRALERLAAFWNPEIMDILMLLQPVETMRLTEGTGDYDLDADGRAIRSLKQDGSSMFTSIRINDPGIFRETPDGPFSYLDLLDRAQEKGRLYGLVHDGSWHHISTPHDLETVRAHYGDIEQA
ncbi:MAG: nucleotidyltransferase family protein [Alphaproteobacteria bacterium]|nr:nucleotidyltransferase family protein [Alphaproteobacteria bacterium]